MSQRKVQSPRATVVKRLGELGMMSRLRTPPTQGPPYSPVPKLGPHPAVRRRTEQAQKPLDASSARVLPHATLLQPDWEGLLPAKGSPRPPP